jgi:hypothetical protein
MLGPVKLREVLSDVFAVGGLTALVFAAWRFDPLAGLAAMGAALLFLAWALWAVDS